MISGSCDHVWAIGLVFDFIMLVLYIIVAINWFWQWSKYAF